VSRGVTNEARPVAKVGHLVATLVNGVGGDPLLHVRLQHARRSLLFDLGEAGRLPARIAHQVTDVFLSHTHIDHIAGFLWFLRSRIGTLPPCRLYGPPGLAENVAGLMAGVHWDRVGERRPRFEIAELGANERVRRFAVTAGHGAARRRGERAAPGGLLLAEPSLRVRATTLDHGTPVLAFALEPSLEIKVRKERLAALGVEPGPWLTELKRKVLEGVLAGTVRLPTGKRRGVRTLAAELLLVQPGSKLVYATDLADTADNRRRLGALAAGAHTLFCEATFCAEHAAQAKRTGHLTARACGEIATAAGVRHLVPFHFSRRYADDPARVYREVAAACARTVIPARIAAEPKAVAAASAQRSEVASLGPTIVDDGC
jgi:ribonuclease Z